MPRPKTSKVDIDAAARRLRAIELRRAGLSYRAIAEQLGCDPSAAYRHVAAELEALRGACAEEAKELRELELDRLDLYLRAIMPKVLAGDTKAVNVALGIGKRRAELTGLDAPVKIEHAGKMYSIAEVSPECSTWDKPPPDEPKDETEGDAIDGA
ncbi:MAG: helix-turn-helix domain-containing protein [Desulfurellales bacterium]|nr:MAG: helix-turn-helix domain-containing protein [Desulfurellales bacterium]